MSYISRIVSILKKQYSMDFHRGYSPYQVLVSCLLSLRTKDEVSVPASGRLFRLARTPEKMLKLSSAEIRKAIYPVGFYRTKAGRIREISRIILQKYNSRVPGSIDELLKLKGVGRKTANIVLTYGFKKPGIAVDTHVHRICNRLGYVRTKTPEQTELRLRKKLPRRYWIVFNELLVRHGQNTCRPVSPKCSVCKIRKYCKRVGVKKSR